MFFMKYIKFPSPCTNKFFHDLQYSVSGPKYRDTHRGNFLKTTCNSFTFYDLSRKNTFN